MINIEDLLKPVSPEKPAGEDLAYDSAMQELDTALLGKPETQFSSAEEPNWKDILAQSVDLLKRSKNLRVHIFLALALLKTEGLGSFRDALTLLRQTVEQYWDVLYPPLDPEDNNDPTERVNILAAMLMPSGPAFEDPMQFHRRLRQAPLCQSPRIGKFGYSDLPNTPPDADGRPKPDASQVEAAFRDTPPEDLEKTLAAISESIAAAQGLDEFLTKTLGNSKAPDWLPLIAVLKDLKKSLTPYLPVELVESEEGGVVAGGEGGGKAPAVSGAISSRQDVVKALQRICEYYTKTEPSSPIPLLLARAQRMAEMNFLEIIGELSPDSMSHVHMVTGVKPA